MTLYTILHVDDDASVLKSVQRQLRKEPYQIISVNNGDDALTLAKYMRFDLVLMDISMPGDNGFKVLKMLRSLDPGIPAIMLTGLVEDFVLYQSVVAGCEDFLEKTCDADWMKHKIKTVLRSKEKPSRRIKISH